jgi:hypothetical protein
MTLEVEYAANPDEEKVCGFVTSYLDSGKDDFLVNDRACVTESSVG